MKIRTKEDLVDLLNDDLAWRKKELTTLLNGVRMASAKKSDTALRAATVLLYAHWEGFIKSAAEKYLSYVKSKKLRLNELESCFIAVALKQKLNTFEATNKSTIHTKIINYVLNSRSDRAKINPNNVIKTNSNLNYSILREILTTIGIDCKSFELKEKLVDAQLLHYRNNIAHGQELIIDEKEYEDIHSEIVGMINEINSRIRNAAIDQTFRVKSSRLGSVS